MIDKKFLLLFLTSTVLLAALFFFYAQIDLLVSSFFFEAKDGFIYNRHPVLLFLYEIVYFVSAGFIISFVLLLAVSLIFKRHFKHLGRRQIIYLTLALAIGPGLLVNGILKEHWGRARPLQITEFNGKADFTPAFVITDFCESNCSFTSGHAAMGFFPMALAFLFGIGTKLRRQILVVGITSGIIFGGARIIQGNHFLSDVIFSGLLTFLVYYLLAAWIKPHLKSE